MLSIKSYTNCPLYRVPEHCVCNFVRFLRDKISVFGDKIKETLCVYGKVNQSLYSTGLA
jgi:hypothetical protein